MRDGDHNIHIKGPGQTINMGSSDWLTQVQHKGDHIDIVDHFHNSQTGLGVPGHEVMSVDRDGNLRFRG